MAMAKKISVADVKALVPVLRKGVEKFGKQYAPGYTTVQLAEAVLVLADMIDERGLGTKEEQTKLARQLAACTSREKGLRNRIAGINNEDDAAELKHDVEKETQTGS